MHIKEDVKLDYSDVLICPKRSTLSSRSAVEINRTYKFRHAKKSWTGVPVMASNMDGVGTFPMAKVLQKHRMMTVIRKHYTLNDWQQNANDLDWNYTVACTGSNAIFDDNAADYKLLRQICERWPVRHICIDVANGYQENFVEFVERVRNDFPEQTLIAGNVCTPEITEQLILSGADIVKVGIGPGSVCTTRIVTGVGYPQLSAVIECADIAHQHKGMVIADGGCTVPGDVAKAFGGGADFVMLGGMLAFHNEGQYDDPCNPTFYGMSSNNAMAKHGARKDGYRTAEGKAVRSKLRGPVNDTVEEILGGLKSTCTYVGAESLKELSKRTTFVRVNRTHNTVFGDK